MTAPTDDEVDGVEEVGRVDVEAAAPAAPTARAPYRLELELPPHGTGARAARRAARGSSRGPGHVGQPPSSRPTRRWMTGFTAGMATCVAVAVGLTAVGVQTLRESRTGRTVTSAQPDEPGFEGFLEPTPTLLVVHERDGEVRSLAVLALARADAGGGSVVLVPPETTVAEGYGSLGLAYAFGASDDDLRGLTEVVTGVGLQEAVGVDDAQLADLVRPVAPLVLQNPDEVEVFPAGPVVLEADDVGPWLSALGTDESPLARLHRQQLFWEAWVAAIAGAPSLDAVPGELDTGLGRFLRGLAAGRHEVVALPVVEEVDGPDADENVEPVAAEVRVDRAAARPVLARAVPFPTGTEAAPRTIVRLLDGAGQADHVARVAPRVVVADASIVVVGNADAFDYETTEVRYHQPEQRAAARRLREALGAGTVIEDVRPIDSFDVTIVLGTDL